MSEAVTDDILDLDAEDETEATTTPANESADDRLNRLEKEVAKRNKENQSLRTRLRRSEWKADYGDFLDVVPEELPLKQQQQILDALKEKYPQRPGQPGQTEQATEASTEEPTSDDINLAKVNEAPAGTEPPNARISYDRYREMVTDPAQHAKAVELRQRGLVDE